MGGLELEPDVVRRAADPDGGWRVGGAEAERAAAALVSHLLQLPENESHTLRLNKRGSGVRKPAGRN